MTTGCVSSTLTDVTLHIYENPTIHVEEAPACSADLTTYGLTVSVSNGATLTSDFGTVTDNGDGTITVSGIPAGQDVTLTVTDMTSDCDAHLEVMAPDCNCPPVEAPEGEGAEICENETIPTLSVTVGDGETADWYNAATGGMLVADNTTTFTPMGGGTFYVETQNMTTGCVSDTRTEISLHIYENPTIEVVDAAVCEADLQTYHVTVSIASGTQLTSNFGTITDNGDGTITVSDIPAGQNIELTVTDMTTNCEGQTDGECTGLRLPDGGCTRR